MAGTASTVPAMRPFSASCAASPSTSGDLQQRELALVRPLVPELRVEDVADLVEVARAAGAVEVDLLALREQLQAVDRAVDARAAALRDLPHVILHRGAAGVAARVADGETDEADVIVRLARVRIEIVTAERVGQPL